MSCIDKEKLIKADIASIENKVRHAFNQGYDLGFKNGKERIKSLNQESVLDKIRAEIEQTAKDYDKFADYRRIYGLWIAIDIIDKYKAEAEQAGNPDRFEGGA